MLVGNVHLTTLFVDAVEVNMFFEFFHRLLHKRLVDSEKGRVLRFAIFPDSIISCDVFTFDPVRGHEALPHIVCAVVIRHKKVHQVPMRVAQEQRLQKRGILAIVYGWGPTREKERRIRL